MHIHDFILEIDNKKANFNCYSSIISLDSPEGVRIEARVPRSWGMDKIREFAKSLLKAQLI